MPKIENGILTATNAEILNTVRQYAPSDYQSRVPAVTQGNVEDAIKALNAYTPDWNVFWNVLLNRIALTIVRQKSFTNPLSYLKRASTRWGTTIQEMQVNLLRAKEYQKHAVNVFGLDGREPDIHVKYHTMNRRDKYEIALPMEQVISGAFTGEEQLSALINSCLAQPMNSDQNDEFVLMLNLLKHYQDFQGFYNIHIDDIVGAPDRDTAVERCEKLATAVRAMNTKLRYYSTDYSSEGRNAGLATLTDRTLLIIPADVDAVMTVQMLAYMFNEKNGELIADRIIVVPKIPIPGVQAILVDEDFFLCSDNIAPFTLTAPINPLNMTQLTVMHHWETLSYSLFANAIMFSTMADTQIMSIDSTVEGVTLLDAQGKDNSTVQPTLDLSTGYIKLPEIKLIATVTGTGNPNQAVRFELAAYDGKGHVTALPADCYVDSYGVFHAGHAKSGAKVVIKAISIADPSKTADYTVTVDGAVPVTGLTATPAAVTVVKGKTATFAVSATPGNATDPTFTAAIADGDANITIAIDRLKSTVSVTGVAAGTAKIVLSANGAEGNKVVTKAVNVTVNNA